MLECITVFVPYMSLKEMGMIGHEYDKLDQKPRQERNFLSLRPSPKHGYMVYPNQFRDLDQELSILMTGSNGRTGSH